MASVGAAIAASPAMPMAHALNAWLYLLGTEPSGIPVARASLQAAQALPADASTAARKKQAAAVSLWSGATAGAGTP